MYEGPIRTQPVLFDLEFRSQYEWCRYHWPLLKEVAEFWEPAFYMDTSNMKVTEYRAIPAEKGNLVPTFTTTPQYLAQIMQRLKMKIAHMDTEFTPDIHQHLLSVQVYYPALGICLIAFSGDQKEWADFCWRFQ
jgi:hypothetical protein